MKRKSPPTLIVIGGHEDREGDKAILAEVVKRVGRGRLVVTTVASEESDELFEEYQKAFSDLGLKRLAHLPINERLEAKGNETLEILEDATGIFFTGGDQLRITSQIGDTPTFQRIQEIYQQGGVIAGTSAGASVMSDTMIVSGNGDESPKAEGVRLAHGLSLLPGVVVDQHFAERGRIGRLLGVVAQNPLCLGLGIDEDTAVIIEGEEHLVVVGSGSVYIVDGRQILTSNVTEAEEDANLSVFGVKLHLLAPGDGFDLERRLPISAGEKEPVEDAMTPSA
jgi:cyanophycinase